MISILRGSLNSALPLDSEQVSLVPIDSKRSPGLKQFRTNVGERHRSNGGLCVQHGTAVGGARFSNSMSSNSTSMSTSDFVETLPNSVTDLKI